MFASPPRIGAVLSRSLSTEIVTRGEPLPGSSTSPVCLIVDDAALIGMALEHQLEDHGFLCATVCSSGEALAWLDAHTPTVAILDYMLADGPCTVLVAALRGRGVPFLVYSGFPARAAGPELGDVRWIDKPAERATLLRAVAGLVSGLPAARL